MFTTLATAVVRRPGRVIAGWLLAIAALTAATFAVYGPAGPRPADSQADFLPARYESARAAGIAARIFPDQPGTSAVLVVRRADGAPLTPDDSARIDGLPQELRVAGVTGVTPGATAPDGRLRLAEARLTGDAHDEATIQAVGRLRDATDDALAGSGLVAGWTGEAAGAADSFLLDMIVNGAMMLVILVLLLVVFRSPTIALLNLFLVLLVAQAATGLLALGGKVFGYALDASTTGLLPVVLLGIGTDYAVFLLFRYRERLRAGEDRRAAMVHAVGRIGGAVTVSALVVAVAFGALVLSRLASFQVLGPALAVAVLLMVAAALTLFPAVYSLLGRRAYWPAKLVASGDDAAARNGRAARAGRLVARRPARVVLTTVAALALLGLGALHHRPSYELDALPTGSESAEALDWLRSGLPAGTLSPTDVYLTGAGVDAAGAERFAERLGEVPIVAAPAGVEIVDGVARVRLLLAEPPYSQRAIDAVESQLRPAAHAAAPPGTRAYVGGETATFADVRAVLDEDLRRVFPVAAGLIGLLLLLMLRGLLASLGLLAAVALGFAATLGTSVLAFQVVGGQPGLNFQLPLVVFLFVTAIGTDYNILMIARLREELRAGRSPRQAAEEAVRRAGPAVAAAGVILAGSFGVLVASPMMAQIGFAVAVGVLIATFGLSWLLVPAAAALTGRAAFWPARTRPATLPAGVAPTSAPSEAVAPARTMAR
ncbi:putative drug exporter of the RND superfamily [Micromonospora citrea]|uniref:Putative drug exporter of the RND superfamily n=1 Tax=Micromonospora citrea TaxID=47855 RepID=A0A1C6UN41_9ACTN|nr:MMPL family transporter [Micromonospora citrea]SCL55446.1 putative drug exporter of the RND superfamily [Micromonospora citrea]